MTGSTTYLIIAFVLLWNSGFIGAEYGLPYAGPFTLLFWRYWALVLVLFIYLVGRGRLKWPGFPIAGEVFLVGVLAHGVWLGCVLESLHRGVPAGIVALVVALQPMVTGAFSGLVVGERTSAFQWTGLLAGFGGVVIVIAARLEGGNAVSLFGYLIPFGSVVAITVATLIQRRREVLGITRNLPLDLMLFFQSLATAVAVTFPAVALEHLRTDWQPEFFAAMLWLIVGVSLGAYGAMWGLLSRLDATRVASLFYLGPPVTMMMAWVAFGDTVKLTDLTGLAVVAAGVGLVQFDKEGKS